MQLSESSFLTLDDLRLFILVQVTIAFLATAWSNASAWDVDPVAASIANILTALDVALNRQIRCHSHRYRTSTCCRWHHRCLLHQWHRWGLHHDLLLLLLECTKHVLLRLIHCNSHGNIVFISWLYLRHLDSINFQIMISDFN